MKSPYRFVEMHAPAVEPDIPDPKRQPTSAQLNSVVSVLVFDDPHGRRREVALTVSMKQRAEKMGLSDKDYCAGLLAFNDRLVA